MFRVKLMVLKKKYRKKNAQPTGAQASPLAMRRCFLAAQKPPLTFNLISSRTLFRAPRSLQAGTLALQSFRFSFYGFYFSKTIRHNSECASTAEP
jgi:hypothetical protein